MSDAVGGYRFKVKPWKHQRAGIRVSWDKEAFALFMEQGTGKSKVVIDTAGMLHQMLKIQGLVVVAPDGVQRAWVRDAVPQHMSPLVDYRAAWWQNKATKKIERALDHLFARGYEGLRVFTINYETLATKEGTAAMRLFTSAFDCMMVCDESHRIKNPKAERSEAVYAFADKVPYRRILTGTPVALSPIDIYGQFVFMDPEILGSRSYVAFKAHYSVLAGPEDHTYHAIKMRLKNTLEAKFGVAKAALILPHRMPQVIARDEQGMPMFRNLDELNSLIKPYSYRCLKADCMDLPPKVYVKRYVQLSKDQRRIYNELREDYIAEFGEHVMVTPMAMTRLTRLQQITGGFFKVDADTEAIPITGKNPKLADVLDVAEQGAGKMLIWARFVAELELIADALEKVHGAGSVARYWGSFSKTKRDADKARFVNSPVCRFFVAQPKAGGTGLDGLQVADTIYYYSNEIALIDRLQSEDRGHRGGSEIHDRVTVMDCEADDTLDRKFIDSLRSKKNVADAITGDDPRAWL